jgi:hypothetical protein
MTVADHITPDEVYRHIKKRADGDPDAEHMAMITDAVSGMVTTWHGPSWPAGVKLGAVMLAARLYRRRNSTQGVENFSEMGATYVARYDSDLDRQLLINQWTPPRVG